MSAGYHWHKRDLHTVSHQQQDVLTSGVDGSRIAVSQIIQVSWNLYIQNSAWMG
jgi:hypothetical protein